MNSFDYKTIKKYGIYFTPELLSKKIVEKIIPDKNYKRILEPSCGQGSFLKHLNKKYKKTKTKIYACDILEKNIKICKKKYRNIRYKNINFEKLENFNFDLIIGNPPFTYCLDHVKKGLSLLSENGYLIFLLRLGFFATDTRYELLNKHQLPIECHVCVQRPKFINNSSDSQEYGIFVWKKDESPEYTKVKLLDWR